MYACDVVTYRRTVLHNATVVIVSAIGRDAGASFVKVVCICPFNVFKTNLYEVISEYKDIIVISYLKMLETCTIL